MGMDNETSAQQKERDEKPLNELLTHSMVDIYVGPDNTHWYIHERLLTFYSPFFSDIFYADDKSEEKRKAQQNKAYGLPDEDDLAFEMLVGWLYSRDIKVPREEKDLGPLLDLYLLADKLRMERLGHELVEAISHYYFQSQSYPTLRRVQYVYSNTDDDNEMREMMVGAVAKQLTTSDKIPAHWASALQKNGELAVDIIRSIQQWKLEEKSIPDARDRSQSRGRHFSAVEREGTDSMETEKTGANSNMGVESLNSDHDQDQDHSMQDSQQKSEDSEATSPAPPTYSSANTPDPSSSQFTTPNLDSRALNGDSENESAKPREPLDTPNKSALRPNIGKRRLSVSFAEKVSYSTYTFFPSPSFNPRSTTDMVKTIGKEGLALQPLPSVYQYTGSDNEKLTEGQIFNSSTSEHTESDTETPIEGQIVKYLPSRPRRTQSDDEVLRFVHQLSTSPARPKTLSRRTSTPEAVMLAFLWMLYLGWLARAGLC